MLAGRKLRSLGLRNPGVGRQKSITVWWLRLGPGGTQGLLRSDEGKKGVAMESDGRRL